MKQIFDVYIGDMEGYDKKHAFYITPDEDDIRLVTDIILFVDKTISHYELTPKGRERFKHLWDTSYTNYSIYLVSEQDRSTLIRKLSSKISKLQKDLDILSFKTEQ